ncbi:zinc ribbon domain-containing protein [Enterococcus sp. BWR-S5]|uniref:zinc ribbon domain-containing protein n=1 Tax=Enterococcus sp. BWR-S5 TaxID=2787714 RepID=UPI001922E1F4|nr:zinc ribbon domain-containing protein [Enterococcus sp. BWR-S5]MBL1225317.1 zinc ribbon domain-containing protein [Enterococcus sp. BWR-S5]
MKQCIACGMPMRKKEDFANQDMTKDYCVYCVKEDGSMVSFSEMVDGTVKFIIQTQGLSEEAAREAAIHQLKQLPHWKNAEE